MPNPDIDRIAKTYNKISIWLVSGVAIIALLVMQIGDLSLSVPILVSVVYSLIAVFAYGTAWKRIAKISPEFLAKFYLAGSALRILAGLVVILFFCAFNRTDSSSIIRFTVVFIIFYIVMLVFDTIYFAKIERRKNIDK